MWTSLPVHAMNALSVGLMEPCAKRLNEFFHNSGLITLLVVAGDSCSSENSSLVFLLHTIFLNLAE